jgi:ribosomal protein L11 methyltransferase
MEWRQFVMNLESIEPDRVEEILQRHGAQSVTLTDAGDNPVLEPAPGETPLWTDTRVTALFTADADFDSLCHDLRQTLELDELPTHHIETLADRVWEREWLKDFGPMQFGQRLWVVPGDIDVAAPDAIVIRLDPGLAFGTGTHPTTALCLEWLEQIDLQGKTVLDFGCGSGILSVAALKLGAAFVTAVDIDLQAITATRQNAARNDVSDALLAGTTIDEDAPQFDIVVANILAGTLSEYAEFICMRLKPGGLLALSGILSEQVEDVANDYRHQIDFAPAVVQDNWARLAGTKH